MSIGPVEYIVIGFPTDRVDADCVPALAELVSEGIVRILDLVFAAKDPEGNVRFFEYDALDDTVAAAYASIDGEADGVFNEDDLLDAAELLEPGTAAALILWEDLWALRFAEAVRASGGRIIDGGRVPHEIVTSALAEIAGTDA
jgi:uncharacterized membrane protein